jgi:hypothetical protein
MERYEVKLCELHPAFDPEQTGLITVYLASDVEVVLKRQAAAAIAGMNAATAISAGQVRQAHRLRSESSPEALESERQANAILTERIAALERALHQIKNGCVDEDDKVNEWYRSAPSEIRKICEIALAGGPVP